MITIYTGVPGGGKSCHVADDIMQYYRKSCNIFVNFEVDEAYLQKRYKKSTGNVFMIDNRDLKYPFGLSGFGQNFSERDKNGRVLEGRNLLVIDECQNNFDSRTWNEEGRSEWNHWLSEHRKDGFDVILITQADTDIDKKIRGRIEYCCKHFKLNNFKLFGWFLGLLAGGNIFIQKYSWYTKGKGKSETISTKFLRGRKAQYNLYNTSKRFIKALDDKPVWRKNLKNYPFPVKR